MYDKEKIDKLAKEYVETQNEKVFNELILQWGILIDVQLAKNYRGFSEGWKDLKQDVLMKLWQERQSVFTTRTKSFYQHYYLRIRDWLHVYAEAIIEKQRQRTKAEIMDDWFEEDEDKDNKWDDVVKAYENESQDKCQKKK